MMKLASLFLVLFFFVGCGSPTDSTPRDEPADAAGDGAPTTPGADSGGTLDGSPEVSPDGGDGGDTRTPPTTDAANDVGSSEPDAKPPTVDSGADIGSADAAEASAPRVDAGADARADAAISDAGADVADGAVDPVCTATTAPACQQAIAADEAVRATFPQPCSPEGLTKCGGVSRGVVETLPIVCRFGVWRLSGVWNGSQWIPGHTCSTGCAAGKICNP